MLIFGDRQWVFPEKDVKIYRCPAVPEDVVLPAGPAPVLEAEQTSLLFSFILGPAYGDDVRAQPHSLILKTK